MTSAYGVRCPRQRKRRRCNGAYTGACLTASPRGLDSDLLRTQLLAVGAAALRFDEPTLAPQVFHLLVHRPGALVWLLIANDHGVHVLRHDGEHVVALGRAWPGRADRHRVAERLRVGVNLLDVRILEQARGSDGVALR